MVKFRKFLEKFTISYIICDVKYATKKKHILYIWKTIGDNTKGFKVRINQHISYFKTGISTCQFLRHVQNCGVKNNCLEEQFSSLNIVSQLGKCDKLETIENYFYLKGYDTINNHGRNLQSI